MKRQPYVSIILPTFNERGNLEILIPQICTILKNSSFEIIVVDDMSTDGSRDTFVTLQKKYEQLHVYERVDKKGLGTAIGFGIERARGTLIIGMDADGNHDPLLLPSLIEYSAPHVLVIASRFVAGGGMHDRYRYYFSMLINYVLRHILRVTVKDCTSGYYAIFKKEVIHFGLSQIYFGYGDYHIRLVYYAHRRGFYICELPVYYKRRMYGKSKSRVLSMCISYIKEAYSISKKRI